MIGGLLFRIGVGATPFLLPLLLQVGFGMTPFESGTITFAAAIGAIVMKFVAPPILRRYGFRNVLVVNALDRRRLRRAPCGLHADDADPAHHGAASHRRLLPLAAIHQHQRAALRRRVARAA